MELTEKQVIAFIGALVRARCTDVEIEIIKKEKKDDE